MSALQDLATKKPSQPKPTSALATLVITSGNYGASKNLDVMGRPFALVPRTIPKTFMSPETTISVEDRSRVATSFDPRVARKLTSVDLLNGRLPQSMSKPLKDQLGGNYSDELDHKIALELSGSNAPENLQVQRGRTGILSFLPGSAKSTDKLENSLAREVKDGTKSLVDAQIELARAKGMKLPEDKAQSIRDKIDQFFLNQPELLTGLADIQKNPLETISKSVSTALNWGKVALTNIPETVAGVGMTALNFGLGVDKTVTQLLGQEKATKFLQDNQDALNQIASEAIPAGDKKTAFNVGSFVGGIIPYALTGLATEKVVLGVAEKVIPSSLSLKMVSGLGEIIKRVADLSSIVTVGQIEHSPQDGTRAEQLKNDLLMTSLFATGGLLFKVASKIEGGLRNSVSNEITPVIDKMKAGEKVPMNEVKASVDNSSQLIKDATGKTPQEIVGEHIKGIAEAKPATTALEALAQAPKLTGAGKISGVARNIEAGAIEAKLTEGFKDLAEYTPAVKAEQAKLIADLMKSDIELAKMAATGRASIPDRMRGEALFSVMKDYAMDTRDGQLALDLAKSPIASEISAAGSKLSLSGINNPNSATAQIRSVARAREIVAEKKMRGSSPESIKTKMKKSLQEKISKSKPSKYSWNSFVDSITC